MSENSQSKETNTERPKKKVLFSGLFEKLKRIKHLDKVLTVLFIAIILLIYFSSFSFGSSSNNNANNNGQTVTENLPTKTLSFYQKELEDKLSTTLSSIKDAGSVTVMVYFSEGIETIIAYTTEVQTNSNGVKVETKSPVLITNDGKTETIVLQENMPQPTSIVVVATGAEKTNVKLEILRAVQTMFNLNGCNIEIFAGN